jgi:hypothetical protein
MRNGGLTYPYDRQGQPAAIQSILAISFYIGLPKLSMPSPMEVVEGACFQ